MARYNSVNSTGSIAVGGTISAPYSGLLTTITTGSGSVTLPNPVLYTGSTQTFYNATVSAVTLATPSGNFTGPGTGGAGTLVLPVGAIITLVSDGTNYIAQAWLGGPVSATSVTASGTLTAQSTVTFNPANASVSIQPSGSGSVTINPGTAGSISNMAGSFTTLSASSGFDNSAANTALIVPKGTQLQRPASPITGMVRYNTDLGLPEFYTGSGWSPIAPNPSITTVTGTINQDNNTTITVNGTNFTNGAIVSISGAATSGSQRDLVTSFVNSGQVTAQTNANIVNFIGNASFDVKITNPSGLSAILAAAGVVDRDPVWATSAGSIGTYAGPATGGTVTEYVDGATTYRVHTFYWNGVSQTFTVNNAVTADIMLLAGGGGGHGAFQSPGGGGGGAGGLLYYPAKSLATGAYTINIGAGGTGGYHEPGNGGFYRGTEGGNTTFTGLTTAVGGGAGGGYSSTPSTTGGSGGGSNWWGDGNSSSVNRAGTTNQGSAGGTAGETSIQNSGGGGGAGGVGGNGGTTSNSNSGAGGAGVTEGSSAVFNWTAAGGTSVLKVNGTGNGYAGGGGAGQGYNGGTNNVSARPLGGAGGGVVIGGQGGQNWECNLSGTNALPNRGSGGGGAGGVSGTAGGAADNVAAYGGYGSAGIVVLRYPVSSTTYTGLSVSASDPDGSPITYALTTGSFPSGMALNTSTGVIEGYPTSVPATDTSYPVTITASSNAISIPRAFSITVQTRPADPDAGRGYSIAQGADGTNVTGYTTTSMTKYEYHTKDQGSAPLDVFNYAAGSGSGFAMHTGHVSVWWSPWLTSVAVNVTAATYGKVLNQFQINKHGNACGTMRFYGSNQAITGSNFYDLSLWTYLGQGYGGGYGSGAEGGVITISGINPNNYGYKWYMFQVVDNSQSVATWPLANNRGQLSGTALSWSGGWAMYGSRYNKV